MEGKHRLAVLVEILILTKDSLLAAEEEEPYRSPPLSPTLAAMTAARPDPPPNLCRSSSVHSQQSAHRLTTSSLLDIKSWPPLSRRDWQWAAVGAAVGFLSPLTGTGGPLVCVPLLLMFSPRLDTGLAVGDRRFSASPTMPQIIGMGLLVGIPVTLVATIYVLLAIGDEVDIGVALCVAAAMAVGIPVGKHLAACLSVECLKAVVALALVAIGTDMFVEVVVAYSHQTEQAAATLS